jgi:hypothetical protein
MTASCVGRYQRHGTLHPLSGHVVRVLISYLVHDGTDRQFFDHDPPDSTHAFIMSASDRLSSTVTQAIAITMVQIMQMTTTLTFWLMITRFRSRLIILKRRAR